MVDLLLQIETLHLEIKIIRLEHKSICMVTDVTAARGAERVEAGWEKRSLQGYRSSCLLNYHLIWHLV